MPETLVKEDEKIKEQVTEDQAAAVSQEKKPRPMIKMLIIFGIMQVVLALGAFFYVKMVVKPKAAVGTELQAQPAATIEVKKEPGQVFLTENIIVNPAGTNGSRYLSTSIGLEHVKSEEMAAKMTELNPIIRDIINVVLSTKTIEELGSPEGKEKIRIEILNKVNEAISPYKVDKVYFVDYVLQ